MTGGGGRIINATIHFEMCTYIFVYIYTSTRNYFDCYNDRIQNERLIDLERSFILFLLNIPSKLYLIRHQLSK